MTEKRLTLSDVARLLNVDASCVSRVFRGTYTGLNNQILPPPSKMLAAIDEIRKAERARMRNRRDRVKTPTVQKIWDILNKSAGRTSGIRTNSTRRIRFMWICRAARTKATFCENSQRR